MSATAEEFHSKFGSVWKSITSSPAYKDAIDTIKQTTDCFEILEYGPPEIEGIGKVLISELRGGLKTLKALDKLADVPEEMPIEEPSDSELYPDPLDEMLENQSLRKRK